MLYLAEVKKQTRGFIGGYKTEVKLLACQHNDQTWSAIPGDDILTYDETKSIGEGALLLVNLSNNRQLQGNPELAGAEMVRQLQKISRLMERSKQDQDKIEQWKQSLTYQSEILNRQKMEMEARIEQIEQVEAEFEYLERQRQQELETLKQQLKDQQQDLEEGQINFNSAPNLSPEQQQFIRSLAERLANNHDLGNSPLQILDSTLESVQGQQAILNSYWRDLEEQKKAVEDRQVANDEMLNHLEQRARELQMSRSAWETAKVQLQIQETILSQKQELFESLNLTLQTTDSTRQMLLSLAQGQDLDFEFTIDLEPLEKMPLEELESLVKNLQIDLDRLENFVNDQEEELTLQSQTVAELEARMTTIDESERANLEAELAEEQERKGMLTQTLVGQRRNLQERQAIRSQHLKILQRRQGILSPEDAQKSGFEPVLILLADHYQNNLAESQRLAAEIKRLQEDLQKSSDSIDGQWSDLEQKTREFEEQDRQWRDANLALLRLKTQVQQYETFLQPVQDHLDQIRQKLETISQWLTPMESNSPY
ncbi:chromosome partition protein Smc [Microcystis aeruginosa NIES-4325]|uniref:Chromosome partition protein Smc n=1 Tax=Microcystis aeruginosa NIES-4325 TaxID=2569534 RepID=A0A5J4F5U8_MICAE|nr:pilus motility taxis protein HmpF [Microcystis aeruginosa]GEA25935.1 chromosome partition protein Smc [Microcystis aeruginosa NIES-4325]